MCYGQGKTIWINSVRPEAARPINSCIDGSPEGYY
jgi:hypothetical protein